MKDTIQVDIQDHVALITMSNPPANTWTRDSLDDLSTLVHELTDNKDI